MNEATLILPNMRGGCATVGTTVHALFRLERRRPSTPTQPARDLARAQAPAASQQRND